MDQCLKTFEKICYYFIFRFIYTDEVACTSLTLDLLAAADKYDLKVLFNKCQRELCSSISTDNAAEYFMAAYLHEQAQLLKKHSLKYILKNYKAVKKTSGFSSIRQNPDALLQILDESAGFDVPIKSNN